MGFLNSIILYINNRTDYGYFNNDKIEAYNRFFFNVPISIFEVETINTSLQT